VLITKSLRLLEELRLFIRLKEEESINYSLFLLNNLPVSFWIIPDLYKNIPTAKPMSDKANLPVAQLAKVFWSS